MVNRRDDVYGSDFAGRMRFGTEVVRAVRAAVPSDFLVGLRMTGDPLTDDIGLGPDDMLEIARYLDGLGAIDLFDISGGTGATLETQAGTVPPDTFDRGCYLPLARAVKDVVSVPVLCAGRILDAEQAEQALAAGDCDLVAMTRAHMADPDIVTKLTAGELDRVRPCIAINDGCIGRSYQRLTVKCAVNPVLGHDELDRPERATTPRRVVVVGGGPAGMEAARVAASRGHQVSLLEAGTGPRRADHHRAQVTAPAASRQARGLVGQ
ncbi:MAG: FAD-binding protein [Streptosporangiales bacterium]|nr:FAD-binding protein [Streptosporangiales bacterium]